MHTEVDILENEILKQYPDVLEILLRDHTTQKNIFWATDNYLELGTEYYFTSEILPELITGINGHVIMPRVKKNKDLQHSRVKNMAEVFTPSWICNEQNNAVDNAWFKRKNVFNKSILNNDGSSTWKSNSVKIKFPKDKSWEDYINENRLELSCGEAPYLTSRYDITTGKFINVKNRIGLLDRKLRIISENVFTSDGWLNAAELAFESTYGFEWQGDSLLLAREALLFTFIEYYVEKFKLEPQLINIQKIAHIISWNVWQMDGLKGVIPNSCNINTQENENLFGDSEKNLVTCNGCESKNINKHNGIYCTIKDWKEKDPITGEKGLIIRFIDLLKN
ncbi:restriction endonuclease subunit M [Flavobacterium sp.]|uniref:restriction endonuclease subunit M n=1 Tax=Flavobacterium sp. TaxID=239 RepID=UPI00391A3987